MSNLREPTHQKWSNFAIFGFIVQFDPWVGANLSFANFAEIWLLYVKYKNKTIFFHEVFPFSS